jgi:MFS superfamily sulfate permease-like transporter
LIVQTTGRLYFANAQRVADKILALVSEARPGVALLDCRAVPDIEYTALKGLIELEASLSDAGVELWLASLNPAALDVIQRSPLAGRLGRERMHFNAETAVRHYQQSRRDLTGSAAGGVPQADPIV